ncbi:MAG: protein translocase subunit SecD [Actinomycetales bacterium]|nr:MAG: protein translocase subunit SecD [Actinomycetales bacterium]
MALNPRTRSSRRTLWSLATILVLLFAGIAASVQWGGGQWSPKLGLDLEGGTEMVLEPVLVDSDASISAGQLDKARDIIAQRVDSNGVAEAEITTQGGRNIVISIPGQPDPATLEQIRKPSQLRFRAVLVATSGLPSATPTATATATLGGVETGAPATSAPVFTMDPVPSTQAPATGANAVIPPALSQEPSDPTAPAAPTEAPATATTPVAPVEGTDPPTTPVPQTTSPTQTTPATPTVTPSDPSDLAWLATDPDITEEFEQLDCSQPGAINEFVDDPEKPLVTCSTNGLEKYVLGPVEIDGTHIADASSGYRPGPNGQPTNEVEVVLELNSDGAEKLLELSQRLVEFQNVDQTRNRFAIVLDKQVISAPQMNDIITNGVASISGSFTIESARELAQQLKFGALPMSFTLQTQDDISPTLGQEQLGLGLLAGLIGMLLVVAYSIFQYRLLGLVTVASLGVAAVTTYGVLTLLGFTHNFRLTMAGVTGVIVAIGVTADSFIVYFERVRDEVREGRPLVTAVDAGWKRAKRTILAADAVNLIAAIVLYVLAASNVRGFAFALGVTTLIDLLVVFLFTYPLVGVLAHTKFFGGGHPWSGLDPERLGAKTRYAGRGRFVGPGTAGAATEGRA